MRSTGFIFFFIMMTSLLFAQNKDVEVYEKKEGDKVIVMARNTGKTEYAVKVTITSEGMDVAPSPIVQATIPGGYMKELATLKPRPGELWSYGYDVSIMQTVAKTTPKSPDAPVATSQNTSAELTTQINQQPNEASLSDAAIILYSKAGCGRCTFAKKQLNSLGIQYLEIDTKSNSPEVPNMWAQMRNQGFKGGSVTMPVIRVNGQYHYDIKDIEGFVAKLKS